MNEDITKILEKGTNIFNPQAKIIANADRALELWEYFENLSSKGTAIVVSSHTMDDAMHCRKLGFLYDGSILIEGTPKELCDNLGDKKMTLEEVFLHIISRE